MMAVVRVNLRRMMMNRAGMLYGACCKERCLTTKCYNRKKDGKRMVLTLCVNKGCGFKHEMEVPAIPQGYTYAR